MRINRSLGFYLLACSAICALIAYEIHQTKLQTAKEIARRLELNFESIPLPIETQVASFVSVVLGVAGVVCLIDYWKRKRTDQTPAA